jgi:quinol-cytochrome oxidoreductase complex cytochrome b subunit
MLRLQGGYLISTYLPFYAILRSIPDKLGGVLAMIGAIITLGLLPLLYSTPFKSIYSKPLYKFFFWLFVGDIFLLGWLGSQVVEEPFILLGQIATVFYFFYFFILLPLLAYLII